MLRLVGIHTRRHSVLSLTVSSPSFLLNNVAHRYTDTQRIVMEYVDNALDDAETFFNKETKSYTRPIIVELDVDRKRKQLVVRDNCRGMDQPELERIVQNVGESSKSGKPYLNGQFGFGVHAFRAAASNLAIRTCTGRGILQLELSRSQDREIPGPVRVMERLNTSTGTGTEITLTGFEPSWLDGLSGHKIATEIEMHFDRLLSRRNLSIRVREPLVGVDHTCAGFDYASLPGQDISSKVAVDGSDIEVFLKVLPADRSDTRPVMVFSNGRRVSTLAQLQSFMRWSANRTYVWSHPSLVGFIEVGNALDPVITRDDFKRTKARDNLYRTLALDVEPMAKDLIDNYNARNYDNVLNKLEGMVSKCLLDSVRTRSQRQRKLQALSDQPIMEKSLKKNAKEIDKQLLEEAEQVAKEPEAVPPPPAPETKAEETPKETKPEVEPPKRHPNIRFVAKVTGSDGA
eukprot:c13770_g1_i1.p1 GENE.c13770_g1_i1~~c13770_g1_i1.p1  ORF type:complete len:471 (-),score=118.74 c13770_g1_i1:656-2032(-)